MNPETIILAEILSEICAMNLLLSKRWIIACASTAFRGLSDKSAGVWGHVVNRPCLDLLCGSPFPVIWNDLTTGVINIALVIALK